MQKDKVCIILGGLLHDIGKPVQRRDKMKAHSIAGEEFLRTECGITDTKILEQVKFHHSSELSNSNIKDDSPAYITYIADNIAAGADRRNNSLSGGFNSEKTLESVFNILNGNDQKYSYKPKTMDDKEGINYPADEDIVFPREVYSKICSDITDCLKGLEYDREYLNSVLEVMEADCSFIPSSTNNSEFADISLFDHSKVTSALGVSIYDYLAETGETDYKTILYKNSSEFYKRNAFMMYSFDISGIQNFIYTIRAEGSLKMLRARSFYLEMLCEHYIDTIIERLELSRANLIYSGGGHGYLLLPNTEKAKTVLDQVHQEVNRWFMDNFKTDLYIAAAYVLCSGNDLMNKNNNYKNIFIRLSEKLSAEKSNRYSAEDIIRMNSGIGQSGERECRICHRSDKDMDNDICSLCEGFINMSDDILEKDFFVIIKNDKGLPLPFGCSMISSGRDRFVKEVITDDEYVRSYCKNKQYMGRNVASKLWIGDYHTEKEFSKLADISEGIRRVAVIRADVDNLGKAFVSGFKEDHVSLSRTATFSRKLSIFFKHHINMIFKEKGFNALIVYSGGDDLFVVSAWSDALAVAITLRDAFLRFSQNTLTISAGIGIYSPDYPISAMAEESGELESASKSAGRNKITLFSSKPYGDERYTFDWDELRDKVIAEKEKTISAYFKDNTERGKNLLYNLLDYLRNIDADDRINFARLAYLLARILSDSEKNKEKTKEEKDRERVFSKAIYHWAGNKVDRQQLMIAIYLYVYKIRSKESGRNE